MDKTFGIRRLQPLTPTTTDNAETANASGADNPDVRAKQPTTTRFKGTQGGLILSPEEIQIKQTLFSQVVQNFNFDELRLQAPLGEDDKQRRARKQDNRQRIRGACEAALTEMKPAGLNIEVRNKIIKDIQDQMLGLGPLEDLLDDDDDEDANFTKPEIADILVNGPHQVYVEIAGKLRLRPDIRFDNDEHLLTIIERIVSRVGRRIDESSPMVDARLPDGSRVNAIIPPLAIDGPSLSIRRFPKRRPTIRDLTNSGSLSDAMAQVLAAAVKIRLNIVVSGGTGTGKTTILNILSANIPEDERIITIEDSAELQLQQPHVVRLETRPPNIEGRGEITQRDLVRNALRMRPDRIILGEVRAAEALDMLQAMNTGHDGSLATVHANTPRDALTRLENMVSMSGLDLPTMSVRNQIASALDVVVQLERFEDGSRRVIEIAEIQGMEGDIIAMATIFKFERHGLHTDGKVLGQHSATGVVPQFQDQIRRRGVILDSNVYNRSQQIL
jgi:pilus assembly protein CpaF